ncbi:sensory neuron membrane protein 1 isoform X2 [Agrilus planipennis]|uniref:Sensory neuron membrane protein 1 isoform X2 n=1 Tax=Agrilus planipennis TaxID=224129 RepID=A0A7F5R706_AGRPL|nr:sensory neuron membrane protein 1 isoform X2 [Agrilus planipennis]
MRIIESYKVIKIISNLTKTNNMTFAGKVAIASGIVFVVVVIFGFIMFPKMVKSKVKQQVALKPGSEIRKMYMKTPFALDFKVYMFNITNAEAVLNGESPVLDEIGPYCYDLWKEKVDPIDNEVNDTLTYKGKMTWIFNKAKSAPLTGDEMVTIPHPLILGIAVAVARDKPAMLSLVSKALNSIFNNPPSPFITATTNEILFEGLTVYCNVTDFAGKAACAQIKSEAKNVIYISDKIFKLSFFGDKNGTVDERPFTVKRGLKNYKDIGRVVEFDNKPNMNVWPTKECNEYHGTDSTIFPPLLQKEEGIVAFSPDICRSLAAVFEKETFVKEVKVNKYTATLGDMSADDSLKCYCPEPNKCLKKGLMEITKCVGAPLYASLPHFYASDESYVHGVRGLHPNEEEHGIYMYFEPMTGTPLGARKRLQFSMPLEPIPKISFMKNLPTTILPVFWVEEIRWFWNNFSSCRCTFFRTTGAR